MAEALKRRGVDTCILTLNNGLKPREEMIGNIVVYSAPRPCSRLPFFLQLLSCAQLVSLFRASDCDYYVNIELKSLAPIGQIAAGDKKHAIWFQDPYDESAYKTMASVDPRFRWNLPKKAHFHSAISWLRATCRRADLILSQARYFIPVLNRLYKPTRPIHFLPNPVEIPKRSLKKAPDPTVCFLGRWDPQKRTEKFLDLAKRFPDIKFIAMGKSNYPQHRARLRREFQSIRNLVMPGFVSEAEKSRILEKSWILVNTSIREGLPVSFLEACAHKTAILSYVNPDRFASRFGFHVQHEDLEFGLNRLLRDDLWKEKSELGYKYVTNIHAIDRVADNLLNLLSRH